jgi:hypothetical protein
MKVLAKKKMYARKELTPNRRMKQKKDKTKWIHLMYQVIGNPSR